MTRHIHAALASPLYRQRKVRARKGRGSYTRKGRPARGEA